MYLILNDKVVIKKSDVAVVSVTDDDKTVKVYNQHLNHLAMVQVEHGTSADALEQIAVSLTETEVSALEI